MRSRTLVRLMPAALLVLLPTLAGASPLLDTHGSIGVQVGVLQAEATDDRETLVGGHLEIRLTRFLGIQGSLGYRTDETYEFRTDDVDLLMDVTSSPITASAKVYVPIPVGLSPYGLAGAGWYRMEYDFSPDAESLLGVTDKTETAFGWHVGGGAVLALAPRVGLFGEYRVVFMDPKRDFDPAIRDRIEHLDFDSTHVQAGLSLFF